MILKIIIMTLACIWAVLNVLVGIFRTSRQMKYAFITGQNVVGIIFVNLFFCLAWFIQLCKGLWSVRGEHGFREAKAKA